MQANAHLIAAAPELLEALEGVRANMDAISETNRKWTIADQRTYERVCAAIARAEGRTADQPTQRTGGLSL